MINVKLAKSLLENEEGTNHMWMEIPAFNFSETEQVQVEISLPKGISRLKNLNGYHEDQSGTIFIDDFSKKADLVIEVFTEETVPCGEKEICVSLKYKDRHDFEKIIHHCISLSIVHEDEMDHLVIDEEVIERVKQLLSFEEGEFVLIPPKFHNVNNRFSELEKKYRIDFGTEIRR